MNNVAELKTENTRTYCDMDEIGLAVDRAKAVTDLLKAQAEDSKDGNRLQGLFNGTVVGALYAIYHELETIDEHLAGKHVKGSGYRLAENQD